MISLATVPPPPQPKEPEPSEARPTLSLPKLLMFIDGPGGHSVLSVDDPREEFINSMERQQPEQWGSQLKPIEPGKFAVLLVSREYFREPIQLNDMTLERARDQQHFGADEDDEYDYVVINHEGQVIPPPRDWCI